MSKKIINFIENPNSGGIPANESIVIKNSKLKGNKTPNFFKSLRFLIKRTSKEFNNKKKRKH
jgi:hypothetical protein